MRRAIEEVVVIVNPASGDGRTGRDWLATAGILRRAGLRFDAIKTTRAGEATEITRRAVRDGRGMVVAAGGDGTINEVVNGFYDDCQRIPSGTRMGILPMGTGGDLRRTFGMSRDIEEAVKVVLEGRARLVDVGRVTCTGAGGETVVRHFLNVADAGIGGDVADMVNGGFKVVNGELTFSIAAAVTLMRWRNRRLRAVIDGHEREVVAQQVVLANCRYYGGGMEIAPAARPDDGLLDLLIVGDVGKLESMRLMGRVRGGTHLPHPKIEHRLVRHVEVSCDEPVGVDADGERPGGLPAVFEVLPGSLEIVAP